MIKPTFGHWIFNKVFWIEFSDHNRDLAKRLDQKPTKEIANPNFRDRLIYVFFLRPWYDVYSRIAYLNGDILKAPIWFRKNLRNPIWRRHGGGVV